MRRPLHPTDFIPRERILKMSENIYIFHYIVTTHIDTLMSKNEDTLPICRTSSGLLAYNLKIIIKVSVVV